MWEETMCISTIHYPITLQNLATVAVCTISKNFDTKQVDKNSIGGLCNGENELHPGLGKRQTSQHSFLELCDLTALRKISAWIICTYHAKRTRTGGIQLRVQDFCKAKQWKILGKERVTNLCLRPRVRWSHAHVERMHTQEVGCNKMWTHDLYKFSPDTLRAPDISSDSERRHRWRTHTLENIIYTNSATYFGPWSPQTWKMPTNWMSFQLFRVLMTSCDKKSSWVSSQKNSHQDKRSSSRVFTEADPEIWGCRASEWRVPGSNRLVWTSGRTGEIFTVSEAERYPDARVETGHAILSRSICCIRKNRRTGFHHSKASLQHGLSWN